MICTSVVPYLSSGLAKSNKIMFVCLSYFPCFFTIVKVWLFSPNGGKNLTPKQPNGMFLVNFFNGTKIK